MAFSSPPGLRTIFGVSNAFGLRHGELVPTDLLGEPLFLDEADNNPTIADYMRPLIVSGLRQDIRVLFLEVVGIDGEHTEAQNIGYFVTRHTPEDGTSILVPGDLLEKDPRTWIDDCLRQMLLFIGRENLEEFSLGALANHIGAK